MIAAVIAAVDEDRCGDGDAGGVMSKRLSGRLVEIAIGARCCC